MLIAKTFLDPNDHDVVEFASAQMSRSSEVRKVILIMAPNLMYHNIIMHSLWDVMD